MESTGALKSHGVVYRSTQGSPTTSSGECYRAAVLLQEYMESLQSLQDPVQLYHQSLRIRSSVSSVGVQQDIEGKCFSAFQMLTVP